MFTGKFFRKTPGSTKLFEGEIECEGKFTTHVDNDVDVVFFGSLYQYPSTNYAQVVAGLFKEKGSTVFSKLDGSFTCIINTPKQTIIVRDHHGTQAQVYYNETHFASSLALLRKTENYSSLVDGKSLGQFLSIGYIPTGRSSFVGITKLGAGSMLIIENNSRKVVNLFETSSIVPVKRECDLETLSQQYEELHLQAIKRLIGNSRNVGILLSGGYDSGCNLSALRKIYDGDINSYTIGFKGDSWSELPLAKCMSETFGTIHHQYEIDGSEVFALPEIVKELGDPFVEGGLMVNYAAMRMIGTDKPDVILGGDGNDQYFGTSGREVAIHYLVAKYGVRPVLRLAREVLSHDCFERNTAIYKIRFHTSKILNILEGNIFGFEPFLLKEILKDTNCLPQKSDKQSDIRSFEHLYTQHLYKSDIEKIINQVILFKASRMAHMFNNNVVFPYMDLDLYAFLMQLPVEFKCKGDSPLRIAKGEVTAKFLLKYNYKPMLPDVVTSKKKQGGFAPMPIFFKDKTQRDRLADFITGSNFLDNFLNRKNVERFIKKYDDEAETTGNWFWYKQNKAIQYFNLLTAAIWWEQNVNGNENVKL